MEFATLTVRIPDRTVLTAKATVPHAPALFLEQFNRTTHYVTLLRVPSPTARTASGFSNMNLLNNVKTIVLEMVLQNKD